MNFFGNSSNLPNGYIYTSHTGSKYVFLEGLWFSHSTKEMIDPRKYSNMYASAQKQIFEYNSKNKMKIGSTYIVEGQEQVFIGNGKFTINGMITEKRQPKIKDFKRIVPNEDTPIPDGMMIDKDIYYSKGKWRMVGDNWKATEPEQIERFNKKAHEMMQNSKDDAVPIGSTINFEGEPYVWDGKNWQAEGEGNFVPDEYLNKNVEKYLKDTDYGTKPQEETKSDKSTEQQPEQPEQSQEEQEKDIFNDPNTPRTELSGYDGEPVNKVNPEQAEVPDGFVYSSPQGKTYFKKKGIWYSSQTKKPLNASNVPLITRAAATQIKSLDRNSKVKIGQEWTSKAGKTYRYVGGNRFISDDGKMLPADYAKKVMAKLESDSTEQSEQPSPNNASDQSQSNAQSNETPDASEKPPVQNDEPAQSSTDDSTGAEAGNELQALASQIKNSPSARNIQILLTRGDAISLLAADILLAGDSDKAKQILQSLNKEG